MEALFSDDAEAKSKATPKKDVADPDQELDVRPYTPGLYILKLRHKNQNN